ncbi:hypothetical protein BJ741DRAFT_686289 [Chytriomyces cf. hyalinus JEL632]|nr:hypothetical protein BJ741DRAFT_686289 [Chytriomyces cf. hyalinus JEL632]
MIAQLIRRNKATIGGEWLLTTRSTFIKNSPSVMNGIQKGGMEVVNNVLKRKHVDQSDAGPPNKERRVDVDYGLIHLFALNMNVSANITYTTHYSDGNSHNETKHYILRDVPEHLIKEHINTIANEHCDRIPFDVEITRIEYEAVMAPIRQVHLMDQRMYGTVLSYHSLRIDPNQTDQNDCVYQYLLKTYSKHIKDLSEEKLREIFFEEEFDIDDFDDDTATTYRVPISQDGVSTSQIQEFCETYGISLYALDLECDIFCRYIPEKRNHHTPALVYVCANDHMYPVIDEELRKSIFSGNRQSVSKSMYRVKHKAQNKRVLDDSLLTQLNVEFDELEKLENTNVVYTKISDLTELAIYLMKNEQVVYKTRNVGGKIVRIDYKNNVIIEINKDYKKVKALCAPLQILFKNQNLITLVLEAFEIYKGSDVIESTLNKETKEVFFKYRKRAISETFYVPHTGSKLKCFDIQKCHSACLSVKNTSPWCVFSIFDEIKPYSGKLRPGFFYVTTENTFPLRGNGWYSVPILNYCQEIGIKFDIVYEIVASMTLKVDYFNEFIDRVYSKCSGHAKFMINSFNGCLNKASVDSFKDHFTMSFNDAVRAYFSNDNTVYTKIDNDIYKISSKTKTPKHFNTIPIYWQVIDNSNMLLHQLAMKIGGRIVRLKTDSVVVEDGNDVECNQGIGNYRKEQLPKSEEWKVTKKFITYYKYDLKTHEWQHNQDQLTSRLITGRAGCGKSTELRNTEQELEKGSYIKLASTNKAARLIDGQTVHHFFHIDNNGKCDLKEAVKIAKKYDFIFIDEVSMLKSEVYEVLYYLKLKTNIKYVLVGDYDQLGPVEMRKRKYLDSLVLKELVDFQMTLLLVNHRSDDSVSRLFELVDTLRPSDFETNHRFTSVNIAFTHAKRKEINEIMMARDKLKKKKMIKIAANPEDPNSQDVSIMAGTPVIANRNYKALKIINSATYTVKKIEPSIMLEDKVTKDILTITKEQFQKYFWVNYCSTCHRVQGESINVPFTIHEWGRMAVDMRYTAISRTTKMEYINVADDRIKHPEDADIDSDKLKRKQKMKRQMKDEMTSPLRDSKA